MFVVTTWYQDKTSRLKAIKRQRFLVKLLTHHNASVLDLSPFHASHPQQHRNFVRVDIYNWGQINAFFKFTYASCAKAKTSWFVGRRYISPSARAPRPWPLECYTNLSYSRWLIGVLNVDLDYTTQICPIYSLMTILCFIAIFQHPITGRCHSWLSRIPFFTKQVVSFSFDVHITLNM